jgi:hypothetical protein
MSKELNKILFASGVDPNNPELNWWWKGQTTDEMKKKYLIANDLMEAPTEEVAVAEEEAPAEEGGGKKGKFDGDRKIAKNIWSLLKGEYGLNVGMEEWLTNVQNKPNLRYNIHELLTSNENLNVDYNEWSQNVFGDTAQEELIQPEEVEITGAQPTPEDDNLDVFGMPVSLQPEVDEEEDKGLEYADQISNITTQLNNLLKQPVLNEDGTVNREATIEQRNSIIDSYPDGTEYAGHKLVDGELRPIVAEEIDLETPFEEIIGVTPEEIEGETETKWVGGLPLITEGGYEKVDTKETKAAKLKAVEDAKQKTANQHVNMLRNKYGDYGFKFKSTYTPGIEGGMGFDKERPSAITMTVEGPTGETLTFDFNKFNEQEIKDFIKGNQVHKTQAQIDKEKEAYELWKKGELDLPTTCDEDDKTKCKDKITLDKIARPSQAAIDYLRLNAPDIEDIPEDDMDAFQKVFSDTLNKATSSDPRMKFITENIQKEVFSRADAKSLEISKKYDTTTQEGLELATNEFKKWYNTEFQTKLKDNKQAKKLFQEYGIAGKDFYQQYSFDYDRYNYDTWLEDNVLRNVDATIDKKGYQPWYSKWRESLASLPSSVKNTKNLLEIGFQEMFEWEKRSKVYKGMQEGFDDGTLNRDMTIGEARKLNPAIDEFITWSIHGWGNDDKLGEFYDTRKKRYENTLATMTEDLDEMQDAEKAMRLFTQYEEGGFVEPVASLIQQLPHMAPTLIGSLLVAGGAASTATGVGTTPGLGMIGVGNLFLAAGSGVMAAQVYGSTFMDGTRRQMEEEYGKDGFTTEEYLEALGQEKYGAQLAPLLTAAAVAGVEYVGGSKGAKLIGGGAKSIVSSGIGRDLMGKTVSNWAGSLLGAGVGAYVGASQEALTEGFQSYIEQVGQNLMNIEQTALFGSEAGDMQTWDGKAKGFNSAFTDNIDMDQIAREAKMGWNMGKLFGFGGLHGSYRALNARTITQQARELTEDIDITPGSATGPIMESWFKSAQEAINKDPNLNKEQKRAQIQELSNIREAALKIPQNVTGKSRRELLNLLETQKTLKNKIKQVDNKTVSQADGTIDQLNETENRMTEIIENATQIEQSLKGPTVSQSIVPTGSKGKNINTLGTEYKDGNIETPNMESLLNQYEKIALKALGFDSQKGTVKREDAVSFVNKHFNQILEGWDPSKGALSTYITANIKPKKSAFYGKEQQLAEKGKSTSLSDERAKELQAEEDQETQGEEFQETGLPSSVAALEKTLEHTKGDILAKTKQDIKQFVASSLGKIREIGKKGKTAITKLTPAAVAKSLAEAAKDNKTRAILKKEIGNYTSNKFKKFVEKAINDGLIDIIPFATMKKRFGNVPGFNIDKIGREKGTAAGTGIYKLSGLEKQALIDYYTDQKVDKSKRQKRYNSLVEILAEGMALEQFAEMKIDEDFMNDLSISLKEAGSELTAEQFIDELEKKFDKRTKEFASLDKVSNIDRFIKNVLEPRIKESGGAAGSSPTPGAIAQALKTALKGYQSLIKAGKTFKEALSRFIKDFISALQTKYSLTRGQIKGVTDLIKQKLKSQADFTQKNLRELVKDFDLKLKGKLKIDSLLTKAGLNKTLDLKKLVLTKEGRQKIVDTFRDEVFILLPRAAWKKDAFTSSNNNYGISKSKGTKAEIAAFDQLKADLRAEIENAPDSVFGDDIYDADGNIVDFKISGYGTVFKGTEIEIKDKAQKFNAQVAAIHKAMWERINNRIKKDKNSTSGIATYLKLTANDRDSWHKRGAQIFGYSPNPKGIRNTLFEYEHAMPATAAYLYLLDSSLSGKNFKANYDLVIDNYKVIALDKAENAKLNKANLARSMPEGWNVFDNSWWERYFNPQVAKFGGGIDPSNIVDINGKPLSKVFNINNKGETKSKELTESENKAKKKIVNTASTITSKNQTTSEIKETLENSQDTQVNAQKVNKKKKGISVFDFDDTLAKTKEKVIVTMPDGTLKSLSPAEFAQQALDLESKGASFDFSQFEDVKGAKKGPLADLALKRQGKFGSGDIFILTARPQTSAQGIKTFLDGIGLNIPIENITGLEDGTSQAKADWVLSKTKEGYNDFYFADDVMQNVKAVKQILDQVDVKSKVQQAIADKATTLDEEFNKQIEEVTGKESYKEYSKARAKLEGKAKDKGFFKWLGRQLTMTPSVEDFMGLMYDLIGKGKQGNKHAQFILDKLMKPFNKAEQAILSAKVTVANDFAALKKAFPSLRTSKLGVNPLMQQIGVGPYTKSNAIRAYMWAKQGMEIPGLSQRDQNALVKAVESDMELKSFADNVILIQKESKYPPPSNNWTAGDISTDILQGLDKGFRNKLMTEFNENAAIIFSEKNMNKLEAIYGTKWVEALKDSLRRMKSGSNRPVYQGGGSRIVNELLDWLNGSVGAIMFLNMRSGLLQLISNVNFVNWGDNNMYQAAKAFASAEYWPTVMKLMNSDYLVNRRDGLKINVNEAELADAAKTGGMKGAIAYMLDKGFIITRIMDSLAIATGGATFYINRRDALLKRQNQETGKKYTKAEAEAQAFDDFYAIAEDSQQSSNPSKISQQQASLAGRVILSFQNVTMQYNRKVKKAIRNLYNRRKNPGQTQRESDLGNLSQIVYYTTIQNVIFHSLQQTLFALLFDDETDDEEKDRAAKVANGMADSLLFGLGFGGAAISTVKNVLLKVMSEHEKKNPKYEEAVWSLFDFSPVLDSKVRKMRTGLKTFSWNREEIKKRGWSLDNPAYLAIAQMISATTNIPIDRVLRKTMNLRAAMDEETRTWQRVALILGWDTWSVGLPYWGLQSTIKKEDEEKAKIKASYKSDIRKMKASGYKKVMARVLKDYDPKDIIELRSPAGTVVYYVKVGKGKQAKN